ncbi:MAG TPA: ABC transporter permease [Candidatus Baltobacteraceae bacterium]|nr:ABC transporter permease [Candidatus Baltobacteraceae bacterium]
MRAILAMTKTYLLLAVRIRTAFMFSFVYPFAYLVLYLTAFGSHVPAAQLIGPLLAFTVLSRALFGIGTQFSMMREREILKRYWLAPITPFQILISRLIGNYLLLMIVLVAQIAIAMIIFRLPLLASPVELFVFLSIGVIGVCAIGLLVPSVANTTQEGQIMNQCLFFLCLLLSGSVLPFLALPTWVREGAMTAPPAVLTLGLSRLFSGHPPANAMLSLGLDLVVCAVTCVAIAAALFRWDRNQVVTTPQRAYAAVSLLPLLAFSVALAYFKVI